MQVRHGAALALREVLRSQADAAGVVAPVAAHPTGSYSTNIVPVDTGLCFCDIYGPAGANYSTAVQV